MTPLHALALGGIMAVLGIYALSDSYQNGWAVWPTGTGIIIMIISILWAIDDRRRKR